MKSTSNNKKTQTGVSNWTCVKVLIINNQIHNINQSETISATKAQKYKLNKFYNSESLNTRIQIANSKTIYIFT